MFPRLYVVIKQDPDAFGDCRTTYPERILAMAKQNTEQAAVLHALLADGWSIDRDHTTGDSIVFYAERDFATPAAAINAAHLSGALDHTLDWYHADQTVTEMTTRIAEAEPKLGDRYVLTSDVERFPHFIARRAMTGTVTDASDLYVALTLDEPLPGAEEWDNAVIFTAGDIDTPRAKATDALRAAAVQLLPEPA